MDLFLYFVHSTEMCEVEDSKRFHRFYHPSAEESIIKMHATLLSMNSSVPDVLVKSINYAKIKHCSKLILRNYLQIFLVLIIFPELIAKKNTWKEWPIQYI